MRKVLDGIPFPLSGAEELKHHYVRVEILKQLALTNSGRLDYHSLCYRVDSVIPGLDRFQFSAILRDHIGRDYIRRYDDLRTGKMFYELSEYGGKFLVWLFGSSNCTKAGYYSETKFGINSRSHK